MQNNAFQHAFQLKKEIKTNSLDKQDLFKEGKYQSSFCRIYQKLVTERGKLKLYFINDK
jgi:hypothetical protein